ncbi:cysteine desulfurase [Naumannella cuiyingiana]|uniref:cysteine desulfurase n=1 Tax=Naumannella cuiyingiana TaxID=1347891 RepID=A0A7Z0IJP6_9ACTN|nr:cysteine desulfurase [Naumannella cuiyingiana]
MPDARSYLDHAASAPMRAEAAAAFAAEAGQPGNPSSLHASGRRARRVLEEARESIAADLGAAPPEVIFTSGGTEADNIAVRGSWIARRAQANRMIISATEHPAVAASAAACAAEGAELIVAGVDADGRIDPDEIGRALRVPTAVLSVHWANNETGALQPVSALAAAARQAGAWSHSDAVQAVKTQPVDFRASGLDLLSATAHKIGGPVGIGVLLARKELAPAALGHGGGQERDVRSGTLAAALAASFAAALRVTVAERDREAARLGALKDRVVAAVAALPGTAINGEPGSPAIVNVEFSGTRASDLLLLLDAAGIDASSGSACSAGVSRPSSVLLAMGRDDDAASAALRFSFGSTTTDGDVDRLVAALPAALDQARAAFG